MSKTSPPACRGRSQRGFTLIEALIAFLVLAVGLIAFSQVQVTLRLNADVSKQRSEAVRIAQEQIEQLRAFTQLAVSADVAVKTFDGTVAALASTAVTGLSTNTTFNVARSISQDPVTQLKVLQVTVSWKDRTVDSSAADNQSVTLSSVIGRTDPSLAAQLQLPPLAATAVRSPLNRNVRIPLQAVDLGGGLSGFTPPGQAGTSFFYVFNSNDASVFQKCTGALTAQNYNDNKSTICTPAPGYFISGSVSFDLGTVGNLVDNGGQRPADPSNTVCDFYQAAQAKGLITSTTALTDLQVASVLLHRSPIDSLLAGPIYALAVNQTASTPTANATGIAVNSNLVVNFTVTPLTSGQSLDSVEIVTGKTILLSQGVVTVESWAGNNTSSVGTGATAAVVSGAGGTARLTINPSSDLGPNTSYALSIPAGALNFKKKKGSTITTELNSAVTLNFTTAGATPQLVSISPITNSTSVAVNTNLTLTFDLPMALGSTGSIVLSRIQGGTAKSVETWTPTSTGISVSGSTVTLTPLAALLPSETYYLTVDSGVLKAAAASGSAAYPGLSDTAYFRFTTAAAAAAGCPTTATAREFMDLTMANFSRSHTGTTASNFACYSDATAKAAQVPFTATSNTQVDPDPGWRYVSYFCVVTGNADDTSTLTWNGRLLLEGPPGWISSTNYKVCRYTNPQNKAAALLTAEDHPQDYVGVKSSITDQNFLVIEGSKSCPSQVLTVQGQSIYYTTTEIQPTPGAN